MTASCLHYYVCFIDEDLTVPFRGLSTGAVFIARSGVVSVPAPVLLQMVTVFQRGR
jgi:hypothetical protein